ncbi:MAG: hypothetical protein KJZ83_02565 [Burkholderiaceae bacterium]|nr:hypothetical protein [Burkholderiaceae bacterium]
MINLKELMTILELHRQGLSVSAIVERTGHDRKTVRKYIHQRLVMPQYGRRAPPPTSLETYESYLRERVHAWPELTGARLLREICELGYRGGKTAVHDFLREIRPAPALVFEVRFETPADRQAQVDFAEVRVELGNDPGVERKVVRDGARSQPLPAGAVCAASRSAHGPADVIPEISSARL